MIHYHGTPITPEESAARVLAGRHAMVSYAEPRQLALVMDACQSFALDNGAFSAWRAGRTMDWGKYRDFVAECAQHPGFDFAIIPDIIDGSEADNDREIQQWIDEFESLADIEIGVPVWHLHESLDRLERLCSNFSRVALGSSGEFAQIGTKRWWNRMAEAMTACCDSEGRPLRKLHGLRMLDPEVFSRFPFASADSTNVARNINLDGKWRQAYAPANESGRAIVLADRIEARQSAAHWDSQVIQQDLFRTGALL